MHDRAGDAGKLPVEIGNDAIHPAFLALAPGLRREAGPVLNPIEPGQ
jgi:hypothetical protein